MNYYVLACQSGREERNIRLLEKTVARDYPGSYIAAYSPVRESREFCAKKWSVKIRPLLPGYIIAVCERELWRIQKDIFLMSDTNYGFLRNADGSYELKGSDERFAMWVESNHGYIKPSKVVLDKRKLSPDEKIRVISGPMKDLSGKIISVYKGVRVNVEVSFLGEVKRLTLPIDIVDTIEDEPAGADKDSLFRAPDDEDAVPESSESSQECDGES